jgi:hypothetical protein
MPPRREKAAAKVAKAAKAGRTTGAAAQAVGGIKKPRPRPKRAAATKAIQKSKSRRAAGAAAAAAAAPAAAEPEDPRTCRRCHQSFAPSQNTATACRYHPEIFSGETKQRWMESGESLQKARDDGSLGEIHFFWTCCGQGERTSVGCARTRHSTYDDPPDSLTYS